MYKNLMKLVLSIFLLSFLVGNAGAASIGLSDWQFNPSGAIAGLPSTFFPIDEITLVGTAYIDNDGLPLPGVAFTEYGAFAATGFQNNGAPLPVLTTGLGLNYQLTAVFTASGVNTAYSGTTADFSFTPGAGTLSLYIDTVFDYGDASAGAPFFGADNGTQIAQMTVRTGKGSLDFSTPTGPDGNVDISFDLSGAGDFLMANVWFDKNGVDLSTYASNTIVGLTDSNNNILDPSDPNDLLDLGNFPAEVPELIGGPLVLGTGDTFTRTDGSFNPGIVPEPNTMALLGLGLLGLAGVIRRRQK